MLVLGVLFVLASGGLGAAIAWENRADVVQLSLWHWDWSGPAYLVLAGGALLACWFMLGAAFIQVRVAERLRARRERRRAEEERWRSWTRQASAHG